MILNTSLISLIIACNNNGVGICGNLHPLYGAISYVTHISLNNSYSWSKCTSCADGTKASDITGMNAIATLLLFFANVLADVGDGVGGRDE